MTEGSIEGSGLSISWLGDLTRRDEITSLFVKEIRSNYISHGELMGGRADAPGKWAPDIAEIHSQELAQLDVSGGPFLEPGVRVAIAERDGQIVGFATVTHDRTQSGKQNAVPFATIEDVVVAGHLQGTGVGSQLISWVEQSLASVGFTRIFLESGVGNEGAHRFFESKGYAVTSLTFMKEIGDKNTSL